jgi:hypothetical protein
MIFRNCRSASSMPAAVQRSAISPDDQRFTLRWVRDGRLRRRPGPLLDILPDGLRRSAVAAGGDASQHPLRHRTRERIAVVATLGTNQPGDVLGQQRLQHLQARAHRQGEQALAGGAGQLGNRQRHLLGQLELGVVGGGGAVGILRHGGPLLVELLGGCPTPTTGQVSGGDRHLKFYGDRDNLQFSGWRLREGSSAPPVVVDLGKRCMGEVRH